MTAAVTWAQSPERGVWRAEVGGTVLTVSCLSVDQWVPEVAGQRGPVCRTRKAAQRWAEDHVTS